MLFRRVRTPRPQMFWTDWRPKLHLKRIVIAGVVVIAAEFRYLSLLYESAPLAFCFHVEPVLTLQRLRGRSAFFPRHIPVTALLDGRVQRLVDLPRLKFLTAQQFDAKQTRCVASRIARFSELAFQQFPILFLRLGFGRGLPVAVNFYCAPTFQ